MMSLSSMWIHGDRSFEVEVDSSNIEAQNGTIGENQTNFGTITVWGKHESVPNDEDRIGPRV